MARHYFFMFLLMAMAILMGSTQEEECKRTGYSCQSDTDCCQPGKCVKTESNQFCDCAGGEQYCQDLPCCGDLQCAKWCRKACANEGEDCTQGQQCCSKARCPSDGVPDEDLGKCPRSTNRLIANATRTG